MEITEIHTFMGEKAIYQKVGEMDYNVLQVPAIGAYVRYDGKEWEVLTITIMGTKDGYDGFATLMGVDEECEDTGEMVENVGFADISPLE